MDYDALQASAADLLAIYGQTWTVTRQGTELGTVRGIRKSVTTSAKQSGLTLAADVKAELLLSATSVAIKAGDKVSTADDSYTILEISKLRPAATVIIYKVLAS